MPKAPPQRSRRKSYSQGPVSIAIRRFIARQIGEVSCGSCEHRGMELIALEPAIFFGGARLSFRCTKCAGEADKVLVGQVI